MRIHSKQRTVADFGKRHATVNVLISGFARQTLASVDDMAAAIDALPALHLRGLDQIVYDPNWETEAALSLTDSGCPRQSKAVFVREARKILVFKFDDLAELRHVLYHEIGHHVFDRVLDSKLRKRWVTLINPRSRHITRYAARNAMEDFAESYAVFVRDPKKMLEIPRKYVFLRDHVFAGISCNLNQGHLDVSF